MPYSRFVESIKAEELVFVSPILLIDPFERRFWGRTIQGMDLCNQIYFVCAILQSLQPTKRLRGRCMLIVMKEQFVFHTILKNY